jgi:hypothetical protein
MAEFTSIRVSLVAGRSVSFDVKLVLLALLCSR